jgi:transposase
MAKKGQKFKKYTLEFKEEVLQEYFDGRGAIELGKEYNIPFKSIETWVRKYNKEGTLKPKKREGRPKRKTNYKEKYEILKKFQIFLEEVDREKR